VTRAARRAPEREKERFLPAFELWFHLDVDEPARANLPELLGEFKPEVFGETAKSGSGAPPFLVPIDVLDLFPKPGARNVFIALLDERVDEFEELRFVFPAKEMAIDLEGDRIGLLDWVGKRPVKWIGHDGGGTITAFYKNDVRQKVVASGTYDLAGKVLVASNLQVLRPPVAVELGAVVLSWDGYHLLKRHRYVIKASHSWLEGQPLPVPIDFWVMMWGDEGAFVTARPRSGQIRPELIVTSAEISEIL